MGLSEWDVPLKERLRFAQATGWAAWLGEHHPAAAAAAGGVEHVAVPVHAAADPTEPLYVEWYNSVWRGILLEGRARAPGLRLGNDWLTDLRLPDAPRGAFWAPFYRGARSNDGRPITADDALGALEHLLDTHASVAGGGATNGNTPGRRWH